MITTIVITILIVINLITVFAAASLSDQLHDAETVIEAQRKKISDQAARITKLENGRPLILNGVVYNPHQIGHIGSRVWRIVIPKQ